MKHSQLQSPVILKLHFGGCFSSFLTYLVWSALTRHLPSAALATSWTLPWSPLMYPSTLQVAASFWRDPVDKVPQALDSHYFTP